MFSITDMSLCIVVMSCLVFLFQAEDGIRDLVRSRGLGDVYKRQGFALLGSAASVPSASAAVAQCPARRSALSSAWVLSLIHI